MTARSARPARHRRIQQAPKHARETGCRIPSPADIEVAAYLATFARPLPW